VKKDQKASAPPNKKKVEEEPSKSDKQKDTACME